MNIFYIFVVLALAAPVFSQTNKPATVKPKAAAPAAKTKTAVPAAKSKPAAAKTPAVTANQPKSDAKPVLTVGEEKITAEEFDSFIEALPEQFRSQARGPMKRKVAEDLVRIKVLAAEARKRGLDKDQATQNRIAFTIDNLLAGAVYAEIAKSAPVDEAALRKYYEEHKNEWQQSQARHILVRFKGSGAPLRPGQKELSDEEALAKAQELRERVVAGEDFATIAKAESDDTGSGANGGSLGTFKRGAMVPAFDQAAFTLPIGQVSEPIKTQFGYHIIQVEKRDAKTFEEAKPEIENKVRPEMARTALETMLTNANVVYDDSYFGPKEQQPAPAAIKPPPVKQ